MISKCTRTQDCIGDVVAVPGEIWASDGYCNHISAKCNKCEGLHWLVEFENEFLAIAREPHQFFDNYVVVDIINRRNQQ